MEGIPEKEEEDGSSAANASQHSKPLSDAPPPPPPPFHSVPAVTDDDFKLLERVSSVSSMTSVDSALDASMLSKLELSLDEEEIRLATTAAGGSNSATRLKSVDKTGKLLDNPKIRDDESISSSESTEPAVTSRFKFGRGSSNVSNRSVSGVSVGSSNAGKRAKERMFTMKDKFKKNMSKKFPRKGGGRGGDSITAPPLVVFDMDVEKPGEDIKAMAQEDFFQPGPLQQDAEEQQQGPKELFKEDTTTKEEATSIPSAVNDSKPSARGQKDTKNIQMPPPSPPPPKGQPPPLYFQPTISARYPPTDHPDSPLNPMLPHFCFPYSDVISLSLDYRMPRIHHFVLTNDMGRKIYGTCLTVYEEYVPPKKNMTQKSPPSSPSQKKKHDGREYYGAVQESFSQKEKAHEDSIEVLISDTYPHTLYIPRVLCLLSTWPYLTAFREYLTQLYRLATLTDLMTAPLERYILNLCAEIPAPPPGAFEIRMNILNSTIRFWAPPANQPIPYVALPFGLLFECLDIGNILFVWYALALERKVLLVSSQYSILTVCAEILCSLLFPMQWSHLYIPILPRFLSPMLDAPMPYLCGISRDNLPYAVADINEETIVVDLDQNVITIGSHMPELPPIPYRRRAKLELALEANVGNVFWNARGLTKKKVAKIQRLGNDSAMDDVLVKAEACWGEKLKTFDEAFNLAYTPDSPNLLLNDGMYDDKGKLEQSMWDAVQEAFLRFYVALLKDYRKFLSEDDIGGDSNSGSKSKRWGARRDFKADEFIKSQRVDFQPFLEELCITQMFDEFVTKRMYNPNEPDVTFFDQSINAKNNRSRLKLKKVDTTFLHSSKAHKELNTIDAVDPNIDDLPDADVKDKYLYKMWPETFDSTLYGKARPVPKIITAEFDRQAKLSSELKEKYAGLDDDAELMGLYEEDCDPNPEVAIFTTFFMTYTAIIGEELELFEQKKRELNRCLPEEDLLGLYSGVARRSEPTIENSNSASQMHSSQHSKNETESTLYTRNIEDDAAAEYPYGFIDDCNGGMDGICCGDNIYATENVVKTLCDRDTENSSCAIDEQSSVFDILFGKVDHSITLNSGSNDNIIDLTAFSEFEEARAVAKAQMDLAFDALIMLRLRGLMPDPDSYSCMMDICSRSGDIGRVTLLLSMIKEDGLVVDSDMYWKFMGAYSNANSALGGFGSEGLGVSDGHLPPASSPAMSRLGGEELGASNAYLPPALSSAQEAAQSSPKPKSWKKSSKQLGHKGTKASTLSNTESSDSDDLLSEDISTADSTGTKSSVGAKSSASNSTAKSGNATDNVTTTSTKIKKSIKKKGSSLNPKRKLNKKNSLIMTESVKKQVELGENLLDMLYPDLHIDTGINSCPKCFKNLEQDDIIFGWEPCDFQNYTTSCPQCNHGTVPRFSVKCSLPTFVGSQGKATPLYCEYLSPWVMRKELLNVMKSDNGIYSLLDPEWRSNADINATLWWNLIVSFKRYKLPLTYLLQGSFNQKLILPAPDSY